MDIVVRKNRHTRKLHAILPAMPRHATMQACPVYVFPTPSLHCRDPVFPWGQGAKHHRHQRGAGPADHVILLLVLSSSAAFSIKDVFIDS